MVWSGVLGSDLLDLRPYFAEEIASMDPQLLPAFTLEGKLVAVPYQVHVGVIEYRTDLVREYGFEHPPRTWDELETMAQKIQAGERAKGNKDFWGYVWQGAESEALTCNGLEWQAAEGAGPIIEADRTISVNNPATVRAWQRAKRWIGWISPPSVVAYRELDARNAFDSGRAAFSRNWAGATRGAVLDDARTISPGLRTKYVDGRQVRLRGNAGRPWRPLQHAGRLWPRGSEPLVPSPGSDRARPLPASVNSSSPSPPPNAPVAASSTTFRWCWTRARARTRARIAVRPSSIAGRSYEPVTRAYADSLHSVLTGEKSAAEAAVELEKELVAITGFKTGPPEVGEGTR